MYHKPEIWLVITHSERRRRNERLDLVAQQGIFEMVPAVCVELPGVRLDGQRIAVYRANRVDEAFGVGDGEHVHDA